MCTVLLPPGVNPNAVNKCHHISYHVMSCHIIIILYHTNDSNGKDVFQPTRCIISAIELLFLIHTAQCSTNFQPTLFCHMLGVTIKDPPLVQSKHVILIQLNFHFCTICIAQYEVVSVSPFVHFSPWHNSETAERIQTSSTITLKSDLTLWDYLVEQPFNILGYKHITQRIQK